MGVGMERDIVTERSPLVPRHFRRLALFARRAPPRQVVVVEHLSLSTRAGGMSITDTRSHGRRGTHGLCREAGLRGVHRRRRRRRHVHRGLRASGTTIVSMHPHNVPREEFKREWRQMGRWVIGA